MVDPEGRVVGRHEGLTFYTIGHRRGLGIGGCGDGRPWFVVGKDLAGNRLLVCQGEDNPLLFAGALHASRMTFLAGRPPAERFSCTAKIRYRQTDQACTVEMQGDEACVRFASPQRAVTPGQSVVLYDGPRLPGRRHHRKGGNRVISALSAPSERKEEKAKKVSKKVLTIGRHLV